MSDENKKKLVQINSINNKENYFHSPEIKRKNIKITDNRIIEQSNEENDMFQICQKCNNPFKDFCLNCYNQQKEYDIKNQYQKKKFTTKKR